jgi:hypothetical protein
LEAGLKFIINWHYNIKIHSILSRVLCHVYFMVLLPRFCLFCPIVTPWYIPQGGWTAGGIMHVH